MRTMTPMTTHPATTTVTEPLEAVTMTTTVPMSTFTAGPLAGFAPEALNGLAGLFLDGGLAPVSATVDGASVGRPGVEVHVSERDLRFVHSLDAARFGSHDECRLCADERDAADAVDDRDLDEVDGPVVDTTRAGWVFDLLDANASGSPRVW